MRMVPYRQGERVSSVGRDIPFGTSMGSSVQCLLNFCVEVLPLSNLRSREMWQADVLSRVRTDRTALAVIDLQVDFCSESGALASLGSDVSASKEVAERVGRFLPEVRDNLALIAFFQLVYDPPLMSESQQERLLRDGKPVICSPEGHGIDLVLMPGQKDKVFQKHRYSAFSNLHFHELLTQRGIDTVVVIGVDTHICVEGTVRHGYDLGYRMIVLSDLVGTRESEGTRHESSLELSERYFALVMDSRRFLEITRRPTFSERNHA